MRREGSPWTGLWTVVGKEMADHLSSARLAVLEALILLTALGAAYAAIQTMRDTVGQDPFLFLRLFTTAREPLPSFVAFLSFLIPLCAIALGFDAINGEYGRRTMSRILAQPIYRDALLLGKFLAGLFTLGVMLVALWLLVTGLGLLLLGIPPNGEEVMRGLAFLVVTLAYAGVWLIVALLFSSIFRQTATAALAALALWLLFAVFWPIVTGVIVDAFRPELSPGYGDSAEILHLQQFVSRLSPNTLYGEATLALLNPETRTLGPVLLSQLQGAVLGSPIPLGQSLLLMWPQLTGLVATVILGFVLAYVLFQRQEIRA
ncbi:MAG TPA: ABC transporter permease [Alphaproteobacteria bacterium]|jgi:ABC-2 type transport system permease protein